MDGNIKHKLTHEMVEGVPVEQSIHRALIYILKISNKNEQKNVLNFIPHTRQHFALSSFVAAQQ